MTGNEIRKKFLKYFQDHGHEVVKSASLLPQNDPTLYFTNAGMVPFKNVFTGDEKRPYSRATSSQKCLRVSGKHNDLENVGRTARHHTFFEMLGNFSFGDYFKKEAIAFGWEFLTKELGFDKSKLWITVFEDDDEAADIWHQDQNIPKDRILRLGEKDNFWSMGETGPCGPCSEIHYEQDIPCSLNNPDCALGQCDCDKYLEVWNLVFMQYNRDHTGKLTPLPNPSIDTGMGLERLTALLQGQSSNYGSDLFTPLLQTIQKTVLKTYGDDAEDDVSMRVLADHIRACVFLINDGILPSNEGRGYVLRRILRRAIRHGKLLGQSHPFFHRLVPTVTGEMAEAYPDLKTNQETITKVIHSEEERFFETLDKGLKILDDEMSKLKKTKHNTLSGSVAFKLYDTYGFPLDLTELILQEQDLSLDHKGFETEMEQQKDRARAAWKGSGDGKINPVYTELAETQKTEFLGYDVLESSALVTNLVQNGKVVKKASEGSCEIVFDKTPFYGESGGQVGDKGDITADGFSAEVTDTQKPHPNIFVHHVTIKKGHIKVGDTVQLKVSRQIRKPTMRNHTATHIMHSALRKVLGTHVRQAGSYVSSEMLRFDFSHFEAIPQDMLREIENEVNQVILNDTAIDKEEMAYDQAIDKGATAFFGDKYGDRVRVVAIGDYSVELCGGTHLDRSSEIGFFKIVSESSIAAGVRRIEAITGEAAMKQAQEESRILHEAVSLLKSPLVATVESIKKLQAQNKSHLKDIENLKAKLLRGGSVDYLKDAFEVNGIKAVVYTTEDAKSVRDVADAIMEKLKSGVSVVCAKDKEKAILVTSVSKDLITRIKASDVLTPLSELIGGRGGGKPERAQAGGNQPKGLSEVPNKLKEILTTYATNTPENP